jgi:hypothetical protein
LATEIPGYTPAFCQFLNMAQLELNLYVLPYTIDVYNLIKLFGSLTNNISASVSDNHVVYRNVRTNYTGIQLAKTLSCIVVPKLKLTVQDTCHPHFNLTWLCIIIKIYVCNKLMPGCISLVGTTLVHKRSVNFSMFAWLIRHGWKYCWLICCERKILYHHW